MKFGAPENLNELDSLDLSLPADHPSNSSMLNGGGETKMYVGCSVWSHDAWVGDLYPEGTKKKDFLEEYIKRMSSIELNSTFYNIKKASMQNWAEAAKGKDFKFCPKFNRNISHIKRLKEDIYELTDYFVEMCMAFGDNLGMTFLQMPENFGPKWFDRLKAFIERIPREFPMAVEIRNQEWYEGEVFDEWFAMLHEHNKTAAITDTAMNRGIIHQRFSNDKVFVRFAGYQEHPTNHTRLDAWAERLKEWIEQGISEIYFFTKQDDETYAPKQADYLIKKMNALTKLGLQSPYEV